MYDIQIILEREYHNQRLDLRMWTYRGASDYSFNAEDFMFSLKDSEGQEHFFPYDKIRKVGVKNLKESSKSFEVVK